MYVSWPFAICNHKKFRSTLYSARFRRIKRVYFKMEFGECSAFDEGIDRLAKIEYFLALLSQGESVQYALYKLFELSIQAKLNEPEKRIYCTQELRAFT